jgi:hypothetical protein
MRNGAKLTWRAVNLARKIVTADTKNGVAEYQLQQLGGWLDSEMVRKHAHRSDRQFGKSAGVTDVVVPHPAPICHSPEVGETATR